MLVKASLIILIPNRAFWQLNEFYKSSSHTNNRDRQRKESTSHINPQAAWQLQKARETHSEIHLNNLIFILRPSQFHESDGAAAGATSIKHILNHRSEISNPIVIKKPEGTQ